MSKRRRRTRADEPPAVLVGLAAIVAVGWLATQLNGAFVPLLCVGSVLAIAVALGIALYKRSQRRQEQQQYEYARDQQSSAMLVATANSINPTRDVVSLSPSDLEELAHQIYKRMGGYKRVEHTGARPGGDGGIDVWMLTYDDQIEVVQCKQFAGRVDRTKLVEFGAAIRQHHAAAGHYWAPGGLTVPALEYASEHGIKAYDAQAIQGMVADAYAADIAAIKARQDQEAAAAAATQAAATAQAREHARLAAQARAARSTSAIAKSLGVTVPQLYILGGLAALVVLTMIGLLVVAIAATRG